MRRVVSLYLPTWPTDRIRRRNGGPPPHEPLVTVHAIGSRRLVRAACATAQGLGLHAGMALAQALVPNLHVAEAVPEEDEAALRELARWAINYSPVAAPDPPDGVWIDIAGAAWAVARFGPGGVVPTGRTVDTVATLPIKALRIAADKLAALLFMAAVVLLIALLPSVSKGREEVFVED